VPHDKTQTGNCGLRKCSSVPLSDCNLGKQFKCLDIKFSIYEIKWFNSGFKKNSKKNYKKNYKKKSNKNLE
jgi:hypothetical protein